MTRMPKSEKLTKTAEKLRDTKSRVDIEKSIESKKLSDLIGLAKNIELLPEDFKNIFDIMKQSHNDDKDDGVSGATATRNNGLRSAVRTNLLANPSLPREYFTQAIKMAGLTAGNSILKNPNITDSDLDRYFNESVMMNWNKDSYSFLAFTKLMMSSNISESLLSSWYADLYDFADWLYLDNMWYHIIKDFLESPLCPYELLEDVARAPFNNMTMSWSETYRKKAVDHKNSNAKIRALAYRMNPLEEYLPDTVKDIFLF